MAAALAAPARAGPTATLPAWGARSFAYNFLKIWTHGVPDSFLDAQQHAGANPTRPGARPALTSAVPRGAQMPLQYQTPDQLYCVKATYVPKNPEDLSAGEQQTSSAYSSNCGSTCQHGPAAKSVHTF